MVVASSDEPSVAHLSVYAPQAELLWSEPITASPEKPVQLVIRSDGDMLLTRTMAAQPWAAFKRVEAGVAAVRGDGDGAVTLVRVADRARSRTYTAGGAGVTTLGAALLSGDGAIYACGEYTETAAFWNHEARATVLQGSEAPTGFFSKFRPGS